MAWQNAPKFERQEKGNFKLGKSTKLINKMLGFDFPFQIQDFVLKWSLA